MELKLTQATTAGGCGCKISPQHLHEILQGHRNTASHPQLLVGNAGNDDAAVMVWEGESCMIHTTDFFLPIVDDPYDFGRIAAANALSDVWAMGGSPVMALAILGWPVGKLGTASASRVMQGAREMCEKAGVVLAGGHSIETQEPLFGLSVTGKVDRASIKENHGLNPGDVLYLTKPLGVGVMATALKRGLVDAEGFQTALASMTTLNTFGAVAGKMSGVSAMTDVTGFGLVGHLMEMLQPKALGAILDFESIPILEAAKPWIEQNIYADMAMKTYSRFASETNISGMAQLIPLFDPQTSGGLLIAVHPESEAQFLTEASKANQAVYHIGNCTEKGEKTLWVNV